MDSKVHQQIPALLDLAHDRSEAGRIALVGKLSEVFLTQSAALTSKEEKLVHDLIEEIIKSDNQTVRQALITQFASAINVPRPAAVRVARAPIELARNVLAANENLCDEDLITIIQSKGDDHASAIATRRQVSEAVSDALVTTGSIKVMQIVAENLGAKLSAKALDILVDTARLAAMLQKPIMSRPELNPEKALKLFWWVSKDLRRAALERYGFGPGRLDDVLGKTIEEKLKVHLFEKDEPQAMLQIMEWLEERGALTHKILPQLLRMSHYKLFNMVLSHLSKMDISLIEAVSKSNESRLMVAVCKAIGIEKSSFVSIFLMSRGGRSDEHIVHPRELSLALETFDKINVEQAKAMLQSWRENPADLLARTNK